jgi:AhpC/TSA family
MDMPSQQLRRQAVVVVAFTLGLWMMPMPVPAAEVGQPAPDFVMHSTVGESVRLSDYRDKKNVLLFFFLAAFTGV